MILYALLCGTLPFDDEHVPTLFRKIKCNFRYKLTLMFKKLYSFVFLKENVRMLIN